MKREYNYFSKGKPGQGSPFFCAGDDDLAMVAGDGVGIWTNKIFGNIVSGPLSIFCPPEEIRILGMFKLNPSLLMCVPSTDASPISVLVPDAVGGLSKNIRYLIAEAMDVLGGM